MEYKGKKVAIIGFGTEGKSAYNYFQKHGAEVEIREEDKSIELPEGAFSVTGASYLDGLDEFDVIVRSPGVNPGKIKTNTVVTSVTKEFFAKCQSQIIGVTGTKGKGTTSTLIALILKAAGKTVHLGGNIGVPALDFLDSVKSDDITVLELSSYQLEDLTQSPHIAVGLMIASDHLQFHGTMGKYIEAKSHIFKHQKPGDIVVYYQANPKTTEIAQLSKGESRPFFSSNWTHIRGDELWFKDKKICQLSEIGLLGSHNLQNIAAAINATADYLGDLSLVANVLRKFKGLAHRLEFVRELHGVRYINDSYGSVPEATLAAIEAFKNPIVLILGGYSKQGADFSKLVEYIQKTERIKYVLLIGATTDKLSRLFDNAGYSRYKHGFTDMQEAVKVASETSKIGDVVLLAPGTSSFDMFKNFQDRGDQFKRAVANLT